ncbi:hypothetical protein [Leptospira sp. GIMC2001]|uniref:hypothetical protein n=1 Tax=Leptospira sp. GIMC2001 TaxID=1513297 RepID=UPI00234ADCE1|nr:hypothetical protein [Leptospira sp. GIMC2001]WCL49767.1 hypothetical protein O4O04_02800 [Leptospira sp. GIMC2001]
MKIFRVLMLIILILFNLNCESESKDDLISGIPISGNKNIDLLILAQLAANGNCPNLITESNSSFTYSDTSFTICGNNLQIARFTV